MDTGILLWIIARATGLAAYAALCIAVLSGVALRTSVLDFVAKNRAIRSLHDWTTWLWVPLGIVHVLTLVLDKTARIDVLDVFVPFQKSYGQLAIDLAGVRVDYSQLAIGLGTLSLDVFIVVTVTSWLRRRLNDRLWRLIHRTSYVAFAALFLHAYLSGTDFDSPVISAVSWSVALGIGLLSLSRMTLGRLPE